MRLQESTPTLFKCPGSFFGSWGRFMFSLGHVFSLCTGAQFGRFLPGSAGKYAQNKGRHMQGTRYDRNHPTNRASTAWLEVGLTDEKASHKPPLPTTDFFRTAIGGVKPGYTGFVPHARAHFGSSHFGHVEADDPGGPARTGSPPKTDHAVIARHLAALEQSTVACVGIPSLPLPSGPFTASTSSAAGAAPYRQVRHCGYQDPKPPSVLVSWPPARQSASSSTPRRAIIGFGGHRPGERDAHDKVVHGLVGAYHQVHANVVGRQQTVHRGQGRNGQGDSGRRGNFADERTCVQDVGALIEAGKNIQNTVAAHNDWTVHAASPPPAIPSSAMLPGARTMFTPCVITSPVLRFLNTQRSAPEID